MKLPVHMLHPAVPCELTTAEKRPALSVRLLPIFHANQRRNAGELRFLLPFFATFIAKAFLAQDF